MLVLPETLVHSVLDLTPLPRNEELSDEQTPGGGEDPSAALHVSMPEPALFSVVQTVLPFDGSTGVWTSHAVPERTVLPQSHEESECELSEALREPGKSANTTECVGVPTSEHVAEIVGRQGCKIKALRAKTNTYIKTPSRGDVPVFVVTGRKEDVAMVKHEILSAAEKFSLIRASRNKVSALLPLLHGAPWLPGQTTIQVRVPYPVVGLVVGPRGSTIKRIQQQTHTYITTPGREQEPVFEVSGMAEDVERARDEIRAHIALRTVGTDTDLRHDDFLYNGTDVSLNDGGFHGDFC
ncbi:RNA-binding protein MEX3B [Brachyhypopomus gauderio]|uniref:RNA-binding protein MEX3B n=1 Tax=Brachyhypopomus gauderio TaxID=698409 RepID=UPI0040426DC9